MMERIVPSCLADVTHVEDMRYNSSIDVLTALAGICGGNLSMRKAMPVTNHQHAPKACS